MLQKISLSRIEKIILVLFEVGGAEKKKVKFEDLVVATFKKFPDEFHLKSYLEYPDSEAINNVLYHNLKKQGLVSYGNKVFSLTEQGLLVGEKLNELVQGKEVKHSIRLSKYTEKEIKRIKELDGFNLFVKKEKDKILDTDFYGYLGISVRTERNDFIGRVGSLNNFIEELKKTKQDNPVLYGEIISYHNFLIEKFQAIIEYHSKN